MPATDVGNRGKRRGQHRNEERDALLRVEHPNELERHEERERPDGDHVERCADSIALTSPAAASTTTTRSGGTKASSNANARTSPRVDPRTTRNSGFPFNIENTG